MTPPEGDRCLGLAGTMRGKGLHDCTTSQIVELDGSRCRCGRDQFFFNAPETLAGRSSPSQCVGGGANIFDSILPAIKGRKVAVIGRFPNLEPLAAQCRCTSGNRRPQSGDFPDPACEYLLPSMDYVFITGSTFINKTLPRLLASVRCEDSRRRSVNSLEPALVRSRCKSAGGDGRSRCGNRLVARRRGRRPLHLPAWGGNDENEPPRIGKCRVNPRRSLDRGGNNGSERGSIGL